ncbi:MAG: DUF365 domain-containing protein, partial [Thermoplasmata archaeon]|nr:DUF365 domain-containing protein [Thermoplasmata archaeon]
MKLNTEIAGIIYPIMQNNFTILMTRTNPVYVKFITHTKSKKPTKLQKENYLLFYLSKNDKSIIGYSKIQKISFEQPHDILNNFINRIQMNECEFSAYIQGRKSKQLIVLELEKIYKLKKRVIISFPMTMAGRYVSKEQ